LKSGLKTRSIPSILLLGISAYVVITAFGWPLKSALFPVVIGSLVFLMSLLEFLFPLLGKEDIDEKSRGVDGRLSVVADQKDATKRTISIFLWIFGFFLLIFFLGFPLAIPTYAFMFLKIKSREGWNLSLIISGAVFVFFYVLFIKLLNTPLQEGYFFKLIGML